MTETIVFLTGGPYHPVSDQADLIQEWLGDGFRVVKCDGLAAFEALQGCDLFVAAGVHWTGSPSLGYLYRPMEARHQQAFVDYIASGRPVLGLHGGIASYDDWPEFGRLLGFRWDWQVTAHTPESRWPVKIADRGHPVVAGAGDYEVQDELYYNVQVTPGLDFRVHAWAEYHEVRFPMVMTGQGGRLPGAGKTAYLANGHSLAAFDPPAISTIWRNTVKWLLT